MLSPGWCDGLVVLVACLFGFCELAERRCSRCIQGLSVSTNGAAERYGIEGAQILRGVSQIHVIHDLVRNHLM